MTKNYYYGRKISPANKHLPFVRLNLRRGNLLMFIFNTIFRRRQTIVVTLPHYYILRALIKAKIIKKHRLIHIGEDLIFSLNTFKSVNNLFMPLFCTGSDILVVRQPRPVEDCFINNNRRVVNTYAKYVSRKMSDYLARDQKQKTTLCILLGNDCLFDYHRDDVMSSITLEIQKTKFDELIFCAKSDESLKVAENVAARLGRKNVEILDFQMLKTQYDLSALKIFCSPSSLCVELEACGIDYTVFSGYSGLPEFLLRKQSKLLPPFTENGVAKSKLVIIGIKQVGFELIENIRR